MVMSKKIIFCFVTVIACLTAVKIQAQTFKFWVKFIDKNGTPYSVSTPSAYLSPKSIQRRTNQGIPIHFSDLPVTPAYATQVDAVATVTVLYRSKWLNGVVVACPNTATATINSFTFVASTGPVNKYKIVLPEISPEYNINNMAGKAANTATFNYGNGNWQSKMMQVDCLHNMGFREIGRASCRERV